MSSARFADSRTFKWKLNVLRSITLAMVPGLRADKQEQGNRPSPKESKTPEATRSTEIAKWVELRRFRTNMMKIRIPLPENDPSGGEAEWVWAEPIGSENFALRNVPIFAFGLSYGDVIRARLEGDILAFEGISHRGGHSTYRIYSTHKRNSPDVVSLLQEPEKMNCNLEYATDHIIGVDVPPESNVYSVYAALQKAENAGIIKFEEGHCGHPLRQ